MTSRSNHMSSHSLNLPCNKAYENKLIINKPTNFPNGCHFEAKRTSDIYLVCGKSNPKSIYIWDQPFGNLVNNQKRVVIKQNKNKTSFSVMFFFKNRHLSIFPIFVLLSFQCWQKCFFQVDRFYLQNFKKITGSHHIQKTKTRLWVWKSWVWISFHHLQDHGQIYLFTH